MSGSGVLISAFKLRRLKKQATKSKSWTKFLGQVLHSLYGDRLKTLSLSGRGENVEAAIPPHVVDTVQSMNKEFQNAINICYNLNNFKSIFYKF